MPHIYREAESIRRLRRAGTVLFAIIAGLLLAHTALLELIREKQNQTEHLGAQVDDQFTDFTMIGRSAQGILMLRDGTQESELLDTKRAAIATQVAAAEARERELERMVGTLSGRLVSLDLPAEARNDYRRVVAAFLQRAADLGSTDSGPTMRTWTLPDLAIAPHGVITGYLKLVKQQAREAGEQWRAIGMWVSLVSIVVVTVLSAILVFGYFHPLSDRALRDFLELQASLSVRTRYFYQMSHELRTPLNVINGYAELITRSAEASGDRRSGEYARTVFQAGRQLSRRVDDILLLAELQSGTYRNMPERLNPIVAVQSAATAAAIEGRTIEIVDTRGRVDPVALDRSALAAILTQLIRNGLQHARERCVVRLGAADGEVIIEVCDDGPGIDGAEIQRLTRPFHTASNAVMEADSGPGMGLAIVTGLALLNGISIDVGTAGSFGTVFRLAIPVAQDHASKSPDHAGQLPHGSSAGMPCAS